MSRVKNNLWEKYPPRGQKRTECIHCKEFYIQHCSDKEDPSGCWNYQMLVKRKESKSKKSLYK